MSIKAIVVGAGAAGTSAAFRLKEAGCDVRVLERDGHVGGRTISKYHNGFIMDLGAGLMPSTYKAVYRLMDDAGLKDMLEPMTSPTAIYRDGRYHYIEATNMFGSMLKSKVVSLMSKLKLAPAVIQGLRMWKQLDFENLGRAAAYDNPNESLAAYSRRVLNKEILDYLITPMQKIMYVMSPEDASIVDLFWTTKNLFADDAYCVRGGMGRIVDLISQQLNVSLNTEVLSVTEVGNQVEVRMRNPDGSETTDTVDICVIATPGNIVPQIDRGLSDAGKEFFSKINYSMLADTHVQLKSRPDERAVMVLIPDEVDKDLCALLIDHNKGSDRAPPGKGAVTIYLDDAWCRKNWQLSDEQISKVAIARAERVMPGIADLVESYHVQRWEFAATVSHPGSWGDVAKFASRLDLKRRVQLAGDYFSLACVNTAVTSGELVAKRLIENYVH